MRIESAHFEELAKVFRQAQATAEQRADAPVGPLIGTLQSFGGAMAAAVWAKAADLLDEALDRARTEAETDEATLRRICKEAAEAVLRESASRAHRLPTGTESS